MKKAAQKAKEELKAHREHLEVLVRERTKELEAEITERKKAEKALQSERDLLQAVMDSAKNMHLVYLDRDFNFVRVNAAYAETCGYKPAEMIGKNHFALYPHEENEAIFRRVRDTGTAFEVRDKPFEFSDQPERGVTYWDWTLTPLKDAAGVVTGLVLALRETTEQKRAEEALRQRERLYRAIGESIDYGIWICDAQGRNTYASESLLKLVGITQDQCKDFGWGSVLHPDDAEATIAAWKQCIQTGGPWYREHRYLGVDGRYHPILACGVPVRDEHGRIVQWAGINLDISRLKRAEEAIRESEERLRLTLKASEVGTFEVDLPTGAGRWNSVEYELLGLKPGDAPAGPETFFRFVHPQDVAELRAQWEEATRTGRFDAEFRVIRADGQQRWLAGKGEFVFEETADAGNTPETRSPLRFLGVNFDITDRKSIEEELKLLTEDLESIVLERTIDLTNANNALATEIAERKEIEKRIMSTNELLKLFSQSLVRREYLDELVSLLRKWCSCDGVGIRLTDEHGNISYASFSGISEDFREKENFVSGDKEECLCPRIMAGRPVPRETELMTPSGSFFCNDMEGFLSAMTDEERKSYRETCAKFGYSSLATIPIRYRDNVLGAIHLVDRNRDKVPLKHIQFVEMLSPLIGEALYRFYIEEALMNSREQLRNLSLHLQTAREEERKKIAREIHDELGQTLTAASMEISRIRARTSRKAVADLAESASGLIDGAVKDIQRICSDLRPRVLDHLGLLAAIEWQTKQFSERSGIRCNIEIIESPDGLPEAASTALFRIFQEALTNVGRHAGATEVTVGMKADGGSLILKVSDNGKGIRKDKIFGKNSFGIIGIRERVHDLGGDVSFETSGNGGTSITVKIPIITVK